MITVTDGSRLDTVTQVDVPPGGGRATVLVVDDHAGFRGVARRMLEGAGFSVSEAATGGEGATAAAALRPELVLLDVQLPDLDGFAVAELIAEKAPDSTVVLISSHEASDFGGRVEAASAAGFVTKDELSAAVLRRLMPGGRR